MSGNTCSTSERPTVTRHKDELREEIKAAKRRRKEEKRHQTTKGSFDPRTLEAKLEELQAMKSSSGEGEQKEHVPSVTFQVPTDSTNSKDLQK